MTPCATFCLEHIEPSATIDYTPKWQYEAIGDGRRYSADFNRPFVTRNDKQLVWTTTDDYWFT
jgi:hypothetical protein